jgi:hypothetical protein
MNEMIKTPVADEEVFAAFKPRSLGEIRRDCERELAGTALRDTRSAFRFIEQKLEVNLDAVPGTAPEVRGLLDRLSPAMGGVSPKRLENIRSLIRKAVERFGSKRVWITREVTLASEWVALMKLIEEREHRWGLSRLAAYCTIKGLAPTEVCSDTLIGFQEALEAESLIGDPANLRKHTIAVWNMCHSGVVGWPDIRLSSPFKKDPYSLPLSAFPASLAGDLKAWAARMTDIDPFEADAPTRPMRPVTLESYRIAVCRLASVLVREHGLSADDITGVRVILEIETFKNALRPFLPANGKFSDGYAYKMASQMRVNRQTSVASARRPSLSDRGDRGQAQARFGSEDGPSAIGTDLSHLTIRRIVQRVFAFPEEELARALKLNNPLQTGQGCRAGACHLDPDLHGSQGQKSALAEAGYEHSPVRSPHVH